MSVPTARWSAALPTGTEYPEMSHGQLVKTQERDGFIKIEVGMPWADEECIICGRDLEDDLEPPLELFALHRAEDGARPHAMCNTCWPDFLRVKEQDQELFTNLTCPSCRVPLPVGDDGRDRLRLAIFDERRRADAARRAAARPARRPSAPPEDAPDPLGDGGDGSDGGERGDGGALRPLPVAGWGPRPGPVPESPYPPPGEQFSFFYVPLMLAALGHPDAQRSRFLPEADLVAWKAIIDGVMQDGVFREQHRSSLGDDDAFDPDDLTFDRLVFAVAGVISMRLGHVGGGDGETDVAAIFAHISRHDGYIPAERQEEICQPESPDYQAGYRRYGFPDRVAATLYRLGYSNAYRGGGGGGGGGGGSGGRQAPSPGFCQICRRNDPSSTKLAGHTGRHLGGPGLSARSTTPPAGIDDGQHAAASCSSHGGGTGSGVGAFA